MFGVNDSNFIPQSILDLLNKNILDNSDPYDFPTIFELIEEEEEDKKYIVQECISKYIQEGGE